MAMSDEHMRPKKVKRLEAGVFSVTNAFLEHQAKAKRWFSFFNKSQCDLQAALIIFFALR